MTAEPRKRRSARHVLAAGKILQKEARKILRKYAPRLPADAADEIRAAVAAIDTHRSAGRMEPLEDEAERLDELLHQHASFARKSALRETVENVVVAVLVALSLRSCFYEPFKIPSGSMMPTLRSGDHIFVNKFVYGIQIPLTNTVIGESLGHIERGDVIVFRFPLDESEDFIKRVIGLPGDRIRVEGRKVFIARADDEEFEEIERKVTKTRCLDETGQKVVANCRLYEETLDGRTYVVRYTQPEELANLTADPPKVYRVPERHLLVMGDNRNQSHDSLAWEVTVEAVAADALLSFKDLRDLTDETLFTLSRPSSPDKADDPSYDHVVYQADHRSAAHDLELSIWRDPSLHPKLVFDALVARSKGRETTLAALASGKGGPRGAAKDRVLAVGEGIDALAIAPSADGHVIMAYLAPAKAVLSFRCGKRECGRPAKVAARFARVLAAFHRDHEQAAKEIVRGNRKVRYARHWTSRQSPEDRLARWRFGVGDPGTQGVLDVIAFRDPDEGLAVVKDAGLLMFGALEARVEPRAGLEAQTYIIPRPHGFGLVMSQTDSSMVVIVDCGRAVCKSDADAVKLAKKLASRLGAASRDRRQFDALISEADVKLAPVALPRRDAYPFDRITLQGTVRGPEHSLDIEVWRTPEAGTQATLATIRAKFPELAGDEQVAPDGYYGLSKTGHVFAFAIAASDAVVKVRCSTGLCESVELARDLARRAFEKAQDPANFVDPDASRQKPFVPRGNVKGRAERIWLPFSRFWLPAH